MDDDKPEDGPVELPIPVEDISKAPVEVPGADDRARKESSALAHEQEQFKKELGWLGHPFGGRTEKPGNISGLVIVLCFVLIAGYYGAERYTAINHPQHAAGMAPFERVFSGLMSIVTLILGYLFGSNERSSK